MNILRSAWTFPYFITGRANVGFCPICEKKVVFIKRASWLRDNYFCWRCGSIPRFRGLIYVLNKEYPNWRDLEIHESSPAGASSTKIETECKHYTPTQYYTDVPFGTLKNGVRSEDLEAMTFPDNTFDIVVTQ